MISWRGKTREGEGVGMGDQGKGGEKREEEGKRKEGERKKAT